MAAKSSFEKAAQQFGNYRKSNKTLTLIPNGNRVVFTDGGNHIWVSGSVALTESMELPLTDKTTVGEICRFISDHLEEWRRPGLRPPGKLKGATSSGSFEDLIGREGARLEKEGYLTLGRYPVASVVIKGSSRPVQMPSKPDFEGAFASGHQFIVEAKVCTSSAFEVVKDKLKPKQVSHMLTRARFNVPCFLLIHFNERSGATFYEPAFTVAIPVKSENQGGLPIWEELVTRKGAYVGSFSREIAREVGVAVPWHTPPRCKGVRPDLKSFLKQP